MKYVVIYTERKTLVVNAKDEATARKRATAVLTGGALTPRVEGLVIEQVVKW